MSRMSELHYEIMQGYEPEDPEIEYHMTYPEKYRFTPNIWNWFEKKYLIPRLMQNYKRVEYIKAEKMEDLF